MQERSKKYYDLRNFEFLIARIRTDEVTFQTLQDLLMYLRPSAAKSPRLKALTDLVAHPQNLERGYLRDWAIRFAKSAFHHWQLFGKNPTLSRGMPLERWARDLCLSRIELYHEEFIKPYSGISKTELREMIKAVIRTDAETGLPRVADKVDERSRSFVSRLYTDYLHASIFLPHQLTNEFSQSLQRHSLRERSEAENIAAAIERRLVIMFLKYLNQCSIELQGNE